MSMRYKDMKASSALGGGSGLQDLGTGRQFGEGVRETGRRFGESRKSKISNEITPAGLSNYMNDKVGSRKPMRSTTGTLTDRSM